MVFVTDMIVLVGSCAGNALKDKNVLSKNLVFCKHCLKVGRDVIQ